MARGFGGFLFGKLHKFLSEAKKKKEKSAAGIKSALGSSPWALARAGRSPQRAKSVANNYKSSNIKGIKSNRTSKRKAHKSKPTNNNKSQAEQAKSPKEQE